ncbi:unnamed protein product [Rangifer tarandus platyrhynchus]|uniref:Uncharacterized protein n=2 Tax=Rangifer tarandus platyrhynchus TaxID=3082113 RepID=A0ABN8ZGZ3_RANTA|nr:unnamed protein product [Rangifer tarandus platyrhynchus]CAI9706000.1 unnamed protein product [Rangifer tarandus platyrhynchus]
MNCTQFFPEVDRGSFPAMWIGSPELEEALGLPCPLVRGNQCAGRGPGLSSCSPPSSFAREEGTRSWLLQAFSLGSPPPTANSLGRAPSLQRPGSLQRLQAQPAWELLAKRQAEAQHQAASSKGAAPTPTPDPRPGGAWRGLESSLVQAGLRWAADYLPSQRRPVDVSEQPRRTRHHPRPRKPEVRRGRRVREQVSGDGPPTRVLLSVHAVTQKPVYSTRFRGTGPAAEPARHRPSPQGPSGNSAAQRPTDREQSGLGAPDVQAPMEPPSPEASDGVIRPPGTPGLLEDELGVLPPSHTQHLAWSVTQRPRS